MQSAEKIRFDGLVCVCVGVCVEGPSLPGDELCRDMGRFPHVRTTYLENCMIITKAVSY
jgi:hypothetical protein